MLIKNNTFKYLSYLLSPHLSVAMRAQYPQACGGTLVLYEVWVWYELEEIYA